MSGARPSRTRAACTSPRSRRWRPATSTSRPSGSATRATSSSPSCPAAATSACGPRELGIDLRGAEKTLLERVKELESQGYQFEAAEGSFELLGRRSKPDYAPPFEVLDVVVISERRRGNSMFAEATVKLRIGDEIVHTVAEGEGPVHALDGAFHKALNPHFPLGATSTWSTTRSASWTRRPPPGRARAC